MPENDSPVADSGTLGLSGKGQYDADKIQVLKGLEPVQLVNMFLLTLLLMTTRVLIRSNIMT